MSSFKNSVRIWFYETASSLHFIVVYPFCFTWILVLLIKCFFLEKWSNQETNMALHISWGCVDQVAPIRDISHFSVSVLCFFPGIPKTKILLFEYF